MRDDMDSAMPSMTHRATFALDEVTAGRLKRLAATWQVSQAEVVRRAVAEVDRASPTVKQDPLEMLRAYHAKGGFDPAKATAFSAEVAENRNHWRGE